MPSIDRKWNPHKQWEFERVDITKDEERKIIGAVAEVALKVLFNNFTYKFGEKYFHQSEGGPIGVRATGAAAQLVMEHWGGEYRSLLEAAGLQIFMLSGYVDDGRQISSVLKPGMRFVESQFIFSEEAEKEDIKMKEQGESTNQRMARVCRPAMDSVNSDLKFTTESQEDFENERLPTLDFEMWLTQDGVKHSYYQKPMKTPLVLMERSGISHKQKFQILTNELNRRLSNIMQDKIPVSEIKTKIEQYIIELKSSGYNISQAREIICSGIRGWRNRSRKRKRQNVPFYRPAESTIEERMLKEISEKENWYKVNDDEDDDDEGNPSKYAKTSGWLRAQSAPVAGRIPRRHGKRFKKKDQVSSVIFVPHTVGSQLAKDLNEKEEKLKDITGEKVKVVEKSGIKLENILTKNNPWKGMDCKRPNCLLCMTKTLTGKQLKKDCTKRNILYEIKCLTCEERMKTSIEENEGDEEKRKDLITNMEVPRYVGESGRSAYERGFEHLDKLASLHSNSHMLRHLVDAHEGKDFKDVSWGMFIIKFMRTAFERQIEEAVTIQHRSKEKDLLNSRAEYNQSALPRLVARLGDTEKEMKEFEKELKIEKENEERLEAKIRQLRKERNGARLETEKNNPPKKKRRTSTSYISIRSTWGPPTTTAPVKNVAEDTIKEVQRKKRKVVDKQHERLENVKRIEDKIYYGETITDFEMEENRDWGKVLREHRERIENETKERENRIEKKRKKLKRKVRKYTLSVRDF